MPAQTRPRITPPGRNPTTKILAGPTGNPRRLRPTAKPPNSGRAFLEFRITNSRFGLRTGIPTRGSSALPGHQSRARFTRHTMSSKLRSISLKTKKSDTNKVTHFLSTGLPVSSANTKGGRAWEIGTAQTLLRAPAPALSASNVSALLRIPPNNKQPQAQKKCHTMQSDFPSI
jgi:hypothetical protein